MFKKQLFNTLAFTVVIAIMLVCVPFVAVHADDETSLAVNSSVQGTINGAQSLWYEVDVPADGDIDFKLTASRKYFYLSMYLFNTDTYQYENKVKNSGKWTVYDMAIGASEKPAEMSFTGLKAGKYYVLLRSDSSESPSAYNLSCTFTSAPLQSDPEPNDTLDKAAEIGTDYNGTGHISYAEGYVLSGAKGDLEDWYKVTLTKPGTLKIKFQGIPGQYADCFTLKVFKPNFKDDYDYLSCDYTGGKNTVTDRSIENLTPGVYYIKLSGYVNYYSSYTLSTSFIPKNVPAVSVKLLSSKLTTYVGNKLTIKATVTPADSTDTPFIWSSSNVKVATVDNLGNISALAAGTTVITVKTKNGKAATCKLTVTPAVKITAIKLNTIKTTLYKGKTLTLKATVSPSKASNKTISWSSSDNNVATVSATGVVKAVGVGTADITAKATDGSGKSAKCIITVK